VPGATLLKRAQHCGTFLKKGREVRQHRQGIGAEVMLDAFDVGPLCLGSKTEQGKEPRQRGVAMLNGECHRAPFIGEDETAILFVFDETGTGEFLHHAGHGRLPDFERGRDVHHAGVTFRLDQLMNPFEIILGALARGGWRWHDAGIKHGSGGEASRSRLPRRGNSAIFMRMKRLGCWIIATVIGLGAISCDQKKLPGTIPFGARPAASMTATQVFQVNGVIKELLPAEKSARIRHEEITNYMPAMTMVFDLLDTNEFAGLAAGDPVTFRMTVTEKTGWISQIKKRAVDPTELNKIILPANAPLRLVRDVEPLAVGDLLPDYRFTNQLGRAVNLAEFRGQALAITFIFTRCPYPTFCPLMSSNFKTVHDTLRQTTNAPSNWHLVEITIDPDFDTPAQLQGYAARYQVDPARWSLLTGALIDVTALSEQFGMQFTRESGGGISHNLRTVVIDAAGRVQKIIAENKWTADELAAEVIKAAAKR